VEYDLDKHDLVWLQELNCGQNRLPLDRFEFMIWRLETTNAAAIETTLTKAGSRSLRVTPAPLTVAFPP
jgi:hypothetical protein